MADLTKQDADQFVGAISTPGFWSQPKDKQRAAVKALPYFKSAPDSAVDQILDSAPPEIRNFKPAPQATQQNTASNGPGEGTRAWAQFSKPLEHWAGNTYDLASHLPVVGKYAGQARDVLRQGEKESDAVIKAPGAPTGVVPKTLEAVSSTVGSAVPYLAGPGGVAGAGVTGALTAEDKGPVAALKQGVESALFAKFAPAITGKGVAWLSKIPGFKSFPESVKKALVSAALGGSTAAAGGGSLPEIAAQAGTFGAIGARSGEAPPKTEEPPPLPKASSPQQWVGQRVGRAVASAVSAPGRAVTAVKETPGKILQSAKSTATAPVRYAGKVASAYKEGRYSPDGKPAAATPPVMETGDKDHADHPKLVKTLPDAELDKAAEGLDKDAYQRQRLLRQNDIARADMAKNEAKVKEIEAEIDRHVALGKDPSGVSAGKGKGAKTRNLQDELAAAQDVVKRQKDLIAKNIAEIDQIHATPDLVKLYKDEQSARAAKANGKTTAPPPGAKPVDAKTVVDPNAKPTTTKVSGTPRVFPKLEKGLTVVPKGGVPAKNVGTDLPKDVVPASTLRSDTPPNFTRPGAEPEPKAGQNKLTGEIAEQAGFETASGAKGPGSGNAPAKKQITTPARAKAPSGTTQVVSNGGLLPGQRPAFETASGKQGPAVARTTAPPPRKQVEGSTTQAPRAVTGATTSQKLLGSPRPTQAPPTNAPPIAASPKPPRTKNQLPPNVPPQRDNSDLPKPPTPEEVAAGKARLEADKAGGPPKTEVKAAEPPAKAANTAAADAHDAATKAFEEAKAKFEAGKIGPRDWAKAKAEYQVAGEEFDEAMANAGNQATPDVSRDSIGEKSNEKPEFWSHDQPTPPVDEVVNMHREDIKLDPERFQFKRSATGKGGVSDTFSDEDQWDPAKGGVIGVWRDPADGDVYAVNGHHRYGIATKANQDKLNVRFLPANTAEEARTAGALLNIAEASQTTSPIDAAKVFRDQGITEADLGNPKYKLKSKSPLVKQGMALSKLSPRIFKQVVNGDMTEERGVLLGQMMPDRPAEQESVADYLARADKRGKRFSTSELRELIEFVQGSPEARIQGNGPEAAQGGFGWGFDEVQRSYAAEKAQLSDAVRKSLSGEKRLLGAVGKESSASVLGKAGNQINVENSADASKRVAQILETYDKQKLRSGVVGDALTEGAEEIAKGAKFEDAYARIYAKIRDYVGKLNGEGGQAKF